MIRRIVVGVDGSAHADQALRWAVDLAAALAVEVIAVHAIGLLDRIDGDPPTVAEGHHDEIEDRFRRSWCAPLEQAQIPQRRLLRDGNPLSVLLDVADAEHADLIVVGRRGAGGRPQRLLGSTSAQLAERAHVPVVIVP